CRSSMIASALARVSTTSACANGPSAASSAGPSVRSTSSRSRRLPRRPCGRCCRSQRGPWSSPSIRLSMSRSTRSRPLTSEAFSRSAPSRRASAAASRSTAAIASSSACARALAALVDGADLRLVVVRAVALRGALVDALEQGVARLLALGGGAARGLLLGAQDLLALLRRLAKGDEFLFQLDEARPAGLQL